METNEKILFIDDQETNYEISDIGKIYNRKTGRELKGSIFNSGYHFVNLTIKGQKKNFLVYRLVAQNFIPNPNNYPVVIHIDGNKQNNFLENLELISKSSNVRHACYKLGKTVKPVIKYNQNFEKEYPSITKVAEENNVSISSISLAVKNHSRDRRGYYWRIK